MTGIVEADEMFISLSYKGNHIQGSFGERRWKPDVVNDMPRKSYRRGSDNKSKSAKDKACVFCMIENGNHAFYANVPGTGFMNEKMLDATVARHVDRVTALMLVAISQDGNFGHYPQCPAVLNKLYRNFLKKSTSTARRQWMCTFVMR